MAAKMWVKSFLFVMGQIGMKFGHKTSIGVFIELNRRIMKIFP